MGSGTCEDARSYFREPYPCDATLALAVMFLDLNPWVAEGMKCIPALAS